MSAVRQICEDPYSPDFDPLKEALYAWEIRRSEPKESHRLALDLIDHALEFDDPLVTGWAYLTCGAHELAANEVNEAEQSLDSAMKLFIRIGEKRGESLSLILRARAHVTRGELHLALEMYKSIIEREAHGLQTLERFEAFNAIAGCFWGLDRVELSLLYLSKAFDTLRNTTHNSERATVLSNVGSALISVGNYEAAREFLTAALKFSAHGSDRVLAFNILMSLTACHIELKDSKQALAIATRLMRNYQDLALAGPSNTALCKAAIAFAMEKEWLIAYECLKAARALALQTDLSISTILFAQV